MSTLEKLSIIVIMAVIAVVGIYFDGLQSNKEIEDCRDAGGVAVVHDVNNKPVCLHPSSIIETTWSGKPLY